MEFYVCVDCEGGACGVGQPHTSLSRDNVNYAFAVKQMSREADAAVRGLFAGGATRVIVWDNHSMSLNLDYDVLDDRCEIALGTFPQRFPGLTSDFAGVCFVGYHAMDSTPDAVMAHTFSSKAYQWMKANGVEVGELAIDAAWAGELGVPPVFVSSDAAGVAEAKRFFGDDLAHVVTKTGYGWNAAVSLHPRRAVKAIAAACEDVARGIAAGNRREPFRFAQPLTFARRYKRMDAVEEKLRQCRSWTRTDPFTLETTVETIRELL